MAELKIDANGKEYIQYESEKEFANALGIDLETKEGDYSEAYHHMSKIWDKVEIDNKF